MRLSTQSRYGTMLMLELALNYNKGNVFLKDVAREEVISEKYLSQLVIPLKARDFISATRGANGGYRLMKNPSLITIKDIVQTLEGTFSLVECVKNPSVCKRPTDCAARNIWEILDKKVSDTLGSVTLENLVKIERKKNNVNPIKKE